MLVLRVHDRLCWGVLTLLLQLVRLPMLQFSVLMLVVHEAEPVPSALSVKVHDSEESVLTVIATPWRLIVVTTAAEVKGVAPATVVVVAVTLSGLRPQPGWRVFCRMVCVVVSTLRAPPVMAQRKASSVWVEAQFSQLPLHSGSSAVETQVRVAVRL